MILFSNYLSELKLINRCVINMANFIIVCSHFLLCWSTIWRYLIVSCFFGWCWIRVIYFQVWHWSNFYLLDNAWRKQIIFIRTSSSFFGSLRLHLPLSCVFFFVFCNFCFVFSVFFHLYLSVTLSLSLCLSHLFPSSFSVCMSPPPLSLFCFHYFFILCIPH